MTTNDKIEIPSPDGELTSIDTIIITDDWPEGSPSSLPLAEAKELTASDRTKAFIRQSSRQPSGLTDADARELEALLGAEDLVETDPGVTGQATRLNQFGLHASGQRTPGTFIPKVASPAPK